MKADELRQKTLADAESTLREFGDDPEHYRPLLDTYANAVMTAGVLRGSWELEGMPVHAVGSRGQLSTHPLVKAIEEAESHVAKLATQLTLTPESRQKRRAGSPMGSGAAADRRGVTQIRKAA